jgi:beta-lactamase regulating signal transducer with metallopeptidase domain
LEPGVFGIFHQVLVLPEGIVEHLTTAQFELIIAHELCHVRRRDNLAAAVQMVVEALFWFYPLVWWIRARLLKERERACDEEVLRAVADPQDYAEGIVAVCSHYLQSPVACMSGVTGSNLRRRIETIMSGCTTQKVNSVRKFLLVSAGVLTVAMPIAVGIIDMPIRLHAQVNVPASKQFEVASVKPNTSSREGFSINPSHGNYSARNVTAMRLITSSFRLQNSQVIGGPKLAGDGEIRCGR